MAYDASQVGLSIFWSALTCQRFYRLRPVAAVLTQTVSISSWIVATGSAAKAGTGIAIQRPILKGLLLLLQTHSQNLQVDLRSLEAVAHQDLA